jgi:hypothetical protein
MKPFFCMKRYFLVLFLSVLISSKLFPQYAKGEMKLMFYEAEMNMLFEEYRDALQNYLALTKIEPRNSNYKYRIGQCLISIEESRRQAIPYLEEAVKNINPNYKEGKFTETGAPFDAYYYLANAYRINNQLEKALATYDIFRKNLDTKIYDSTIVNQQIQSCRNAIELMKVPLYIKKFNLGDLINNQYADMNPVVSGDQSMMVYNKRERFQDALLFTRKVNEKWTAPINIIPDLGLGQEEGNYATSLSNDGKELYIYRRGADYDGNIFVTKRTGDDKWSNLARLNDNINTKYWESHATISHDGRKLYFTSNRKDSYGGLDIYVSERDTGDAWGPAKNLGDVINTPYNEESPFLGTDDKTLYFSSRGHFNIGGYDIFYSTLLENGQWSSPLNLGYPLNTTDEDLFFDPVGDGYQAYYAITDSSGYGLSDIYRIEIFSKDHPRKFFVKGVVQVKDLMAMFGDSIKVSAFNLENPDARVVVYSNPVTGEYKFELPQGNYNITYESKGSELVTRNINIPLTHPADSFVLPGTTLPKTDLVADLNIGDNRNFTVVKGDTIYFPLKVEPNSILTVEHWLGNSLISKETFIINDSTFIYKTVPISGNNRLVFNLTDKYSNTTVSELMINRQKVIDTQQVVRPEYKRVIAQKQVDAFMELLGRNSEGELKNLLRKSATEGKQFGKVDDIIEFFKEEGTRQNIPPSEIDKLALETAVRDNVLSQAAVDLLTAGSEGELKKILNDLNIYDAGLKTWSDLQEYIYKKSEGRILPQDLNRMAADILRGIDPRIAAGKNKLTLYSNFSEKGDAIKQAIESADKSGTANSGDWLNNFYNEALKRGLSDKEIARIFADLSAEPGINAAEFLENLAKVSDESFAAWLRSLDLEDLKISTPEELILYLLRNKDKGLFDEKSLFRALARIIAGKDIGDEIIATRAADTGKKSLLWLWLLAGEAGLAIIIFILFRRRRKKRNKTGN